MLVWEISEQDEKNLDRYEGYPVYYRKRELPVEVFPLGGGEPVNLTAMVYLMADGHPLREPSEGYYQVLADGYRDFHFPMHILEQALADTMGREKAVKRIGECSLTRPGRKEERHEVSH